MADTATQTHEFRAEVRKVLHILTNSLYTDREIFLRELISNASDALDKLRFRVNKGDVPRGAELPSEIRITLDKDGKTLTIVDAGVGMTAAELADNLGTIAKSGSEEFLAGLANGESGADAAEASQIIGRFGVGFYSVFMVASKVEVISRPAFGEDAAHVWASDGLGSYTVEPFTGPEPQRGTIIKAYLKDDAAEFLEKFRVESAIRKHSAFVPFPVFVDDERINTQPALWREPKSSVTSEQYDDFYKALTYDAKAPLEVVHLAIDAPVQFNALLYIPDSAQQDFFGADRDFWGLDLYSRRVLIQRRNKDLIPEYLAFLKGVTDAEDLPLNISRETLQENVLLRKINQTLVKQCLSRLERMATEDAEKYARFWHLHGKVFKLGYHDFVNRERISALLRFNSSALDDGLALTSLDEYMARAPEGQKTFWYVTAPNREAARLSPHLEIFRKKGIEVFYLFEPVDEFVMEGLGKYKEWEFKPAEAAGSEALADFADKEKSDAPEAAPLSAEDTSSFDGLLSRMKDILGDLVKEVRVSQRLADSPAVLVSADGGMTSSMEKLLKVMQKDDSLPVKVLEINRDHALSRSLLRIFKADAADARLAEMTRALFDAALLSDGYLKDPQALAARTNKLLEEAAAWYAEVRKL